jgi:hypothetical protein
MRFCWSLVTCLLAIAATAVCFPAIAVDAQAPPRIRTIAYRPNQLIETLLLPDDEIVVITRNYDAEVPAGKVPSLKQAVNAALYFSDSANVVTVSKVYGVLAEKGTWIATHIEGESIDDLLLKKPVSPRPFSMVYDGGGELTIGNVIVRAIERFKVQPQMKYLMCFSTSRETGVNYPTQTPLLIRDGKLWNPWQLEPGAPKTDPLHGQSFDAVARLIRSRAK